MVHSIGLLLWKRIILPKSTNKDEARREFILNTLLVSLSILTAITFTINVFHPLLYSASEGAHPLISGGIFILVLSLLRISRYGKSRLSAFIFIGLLTAVGVYMDYFWGADLPAVLLFFALLIVMAGILIDTKFAFIIALLCGGSIILFSYLEIIHIYEPHNTWKNEVIHIVDSVVYVLILAIIAVVSWLSNREMERALKRARASETTVKRQRDKLEILVEKRTKELKLTQAEKLAQLYRFAQFGRMASGLFHDLATPLNLISLNLDRLSRRHKRIDKQKISHTRVLLKRAIGGTQRLESFVEAARKQIQGQEILQTFSLNKEVTQVIQMLEHKAKKSHITISFKLKKDVKTFGSPVKFIQIITNLVLNAIDAYENVRRKTKRIEVRVQKVNSNVKLEVQDWGIGIHERDTLKIFDPLFTTKSPKKGIGMGLSICKDIVEKHLKGTCTVESKRGVGTTFAVQFPIKETQKA